MSCSCHGKKGEVVNGKVEPDSQCTTCALKHVEMAQAAWGEFTYEEDNRGWCAGHLRLAVEHLKLDHRNEALECREVANIMELALDKDIREVRDKLGMLHDKVLELFKKDHPEYVGRLEKIKLLSQLKQTSFETEPPMSVFETELPINTIKVAESLPQTQDTSELIFKTELPEEIVLEEPTGPVDIIIPLGPGSVSGDAELKILLRSVEAHAKNLGRVLIATTHIPDWLDTDSVTIVPLEDTEPHNKDANLIYKTTETIRQCNVSHFVWCADDNVFMRDVDLDKIPRLYNPRGRNDFSGEGTWSRRVANTFDYFKHNYGIDVGYNFETHTPQYFSHAKALVKALDPVDYREQPGLTIMTTFRFVMNDLDKGDRQDYQKETFEMADTVKTARFDKLFVGYNDRAFVAGNLKDKLLTVFNKKSKYEK